MITGRINQIEPRARLGAPAHTQAAPIQPRTRRQSAPEAYAKGPTRRDAPLSLYTLYSARSQDHVPSRAALRRVFGVCFTGPRAPSLDHCIIYTTDLLATTPVRTHAHTAFGRARSPPDHRPGVPAGRPSLSSAQSPQRRADALRRPSRMLSSRARATAATVLSLSLSLCLAAGFYVRRTRCYSDTARGRTLRSLGTTMLRRAALPGSSFSATKLEKLEELEELVPLYRLSVPSLCTLSLYRLPVPSLCTLSLYPLSVPSLCALSLYLHSAPPATLTKDKAAASSRGIPHADGAPHAHGERLIRYRELRPM